MPSIQFPYTEEMSWEAWHTRYPAWCHGHEQWKNQSMQADNWIGPSLPPALPLMQRVSSSAATPPRPRVFISHRQGDEKYAKRIAYLADQAGFEYWLDVVNLPPPPVIAKMSAKAVAMQIEMALLNCSHLVAVYTDITTGSTWVPYEYGRVKEPVLSTTACCTWIYIQKTPRLPEWVELNEKREHEQPLIQWFNHEFIKWGGNLSRPVHQWVGTTMQLP